MGTLAQRDRLLEVLASLLALAVGVLEDAEHAEAARFQPVGAAEALDDRRGVFGGAVAVGEAELAVAEQVDLRRGRGSGRRTYDSLP